MTVMNLEAFSEIIRCMNIDNDGCYVEYSTWKEFESGNTTLTNFNKTFFNGSTKRFISKKELFNLAKDPAKTQEFIISTIYWGFSGNNQIMNEYRTNFFKTINKITQAESLINNLRNKNVINFSSEISNKFSKLNANLGESSYSKLLFFLKTEINDNKCIILDSKIKCNLKIFKEFESLNNKYNYEQYVIKMNQVSKNLDVEPEQLEAFIFKLKI
ncbi:MAG: hypothetical protein U0354_18510 [Candidatus Sericytochromatia bacterium]